MMLSRLLACTATTTDDSSVPSDWVAPENRWPITTPPGELAATGYAEGDVPPDLRVPDQFGDTVSLWQFYGRLVVVDISPMWCAPCQEIAAGLEDLLADYQDTDLVYISLVAETVEGAPATKESAEQWASAYGIVSAPVVADLDGFYTNFGDGSTFPVVLGIGRDMVFFEPGFVPTNGEQGIREFIDQNL